jgi:transposase
VTARDNRPFMAAVVWIAGTGSPWRDLPKAFGHRHRVYVRYSRWGKNGTWANLLASVPDRPDLDQLMVDGSIVRVHPHGAAKKQPGRGSEQEAMGKSRGGLSTRIHVAVDAGRPG